MTEKHSELMTMYDPEYSYHAPPTHVQEPSEASQFYGGYPFGYFPFPFSPFRFFFFPPFPFRRRRRRRYW